MARRLLDSAMGSAFCQEILQCLGDQIADGLTTPAGNLSHALNDMERQLDRENRFGLRKSKWFAEFCALAADNGACFLCRRLLPPPFLTTI